MIKDSKVSIIENEMEEESLATDSRILISNNKFLCDPIVLKKVNDKIEFRKHCYSSLIKHCISDISYIIAMYIMKEIV